MSSVSADILSDPAPWGQIGITGPLNSITRILTMRSSVCRAGTPRDASFPIRSPKDRYRVRTQGDLYGGSCATLLYHHRLFRIKQIHHRLPNRTQMGIDRHEVAPRRIIQVHGNHDLGVVQDPRVDKGTSIIDRVPEICAIAGDLPKILPAVSERRLPVSHRRDAGDGLVDGMRYVKAVVAYGLERPPVPPEHTLPNKPIILPATVKPLFRSVVDTRNPLTGQQIADSQDRLVGKWIPVHETPVGPHHLVVVVYEGHEVLACRSMVGIE